MNWLRQLSAGHILLLAFVIWALGLFLVASLPILQNTGYRVFILWELVSPTLITSLLYFRSIRLENSPSKKRQLHVAYLVTLAVVIYGGFSTWRGNPAGSDLMWGLRFDLYQFTALFSGGLAFGISWWVMDMLSARPDPRGTRLPDPEKENQRIPRV